MSCLVADGSLLQNWTDGCRLFEIRSPNQTSGPKFAGTQHVLAIPTHLTLCPPNNISRSLLGMSHFFKPPVALPTECWQKPPKEVHRLEATVSALGNGNPLAKPLVEALPLACSKAKVLPVEDQIIACKNFIERARKRVNRVEAVISRALEQKVVFETEVEEGEARLQQLEESHSVRNEEAAVSITELQRRIDDLTRERDSLRTATPKVLPGIWMADGPPVVESIFFF